MSMEDDHIYQCFVNHFVKADKGNVVLYGTGIHTGALIDKLHGSGISGLMDLKQTGKVFYGYKALSESEVREIPDVCIVIIARDAVINTVYRRIEDFCRENNIIAYDIAGNRLGSDVFDRNEKCFSLDWNLLQEKVDAADIVTFDVFDTLLVRKVFRESDVFALMDAEQTIFDGSFAALRRRAEDKAWGRPQPSIYDIYEAVKELGGITDTERDELLALELATEKSVLARREAVCDLMDKLIMSGKKVYLISDMYLPGKVISGFLSDLGITGYENMFVSCEYGMGKQDGLYELVREKICEGQEQRILHIGDNYYSDIVAAEQAGFDTFQLYSCREMFERSIYAECIPESLNIKNSIVLGMFILTAFSDPFGEYCQNGKLKLNDFKKIMSLFVAPVISEFLLFLCGKVKEKKLEYVVFPSRDGWLLRRMYEEIKKRDEDLPESIYLYTSRRAALVAAARTEKDVRDILSVEDFRNTREKIHARFGIDTGGENETGDPEACIQEMLAVCERENATYMHYLKEKGLLGDKRIALVDFVAIGTVQEALERLLERALSGIYFLRRTSGELKFARLEAEAFYGAKGEYGERNNIYKYYYFLETILSSPEPSFQCMDADGNPEFYEETRPYDEIVKLEEEHEVVLGYFKGLIDVLPATVCGESGLILCDALLGLLDREWSEFDESALFPTGNVDEFMGRTVYSMNR